MINHALFYREILRAESLTLQRADRSSLKVCRSTVANNTLLVKTVKGMERSHMRLVQAKTLVRGGLTLVNEHQFHLQIVMIREPMAYICGQK